MNEDHDMNIKTQQKHDCEHSSRVSCVIVIVELGSTAVLVCHLYYRGLQRTVLLLALNPGGVAFSWENVKIYLYFLPFTILRNLSRWKTRAHIYYAQYQANWCANDTRIQGWHGLISIPAWISNYIHYIVCDEISYSFPYFNGTTFEVWEWISNIIPQFTGHVITYPCRD